MAKIQVTINGKEFVSTEAKKAGDSLTNMKNSGENATKAMEVGAKVAAAAFAGITASITAVSAAAVKVSNLTDDIDKMSQRVGMSRQAYQEWDFILSQNGSSIDSMQMGMKTLSQRMNEAIEGAGTGAELFDKLGLSIDSSMSQEDAFEATVRALQALPEGVEKAALAQELFGRTGQELLPMLNENRGSIDDLRNKAHDLGLILGDDVVDAGVSFKDTMDQMTRSLTAIGATAIAPLLPMLDNLGQSFMGMMQGKEGAGDEMAAALSDTIKTALDAVVEIIPQVLDIGTQVIFSLIEGITSDIGLLAETAINIVLSLVDSIIENLPMLITAAIDIILTLANGIVDAVPELITRVPQIIEALLQGFIENAPKILLAGIEIILSMAEGLIKAIPTLVTYLPQIITTMVNSFKEAVPQFLEMGKNIIEGLTQGIKDFALKPVDAVKDAGKKIVDGFKDFFGIRSPSKVFIEFGKYFMEGLAQGIADNSGMVANALQDLGVNPSLPTEVSIHTTVIPGSSSVSNTPGSEQSNSNGFMSFINAFSEGLGGLISSLSSVQAILDPISTILNAAMDVLSPVIDSVLSPLVGILKILGNSIGQVLTPVIQWLTPVIELLGEVFVWLYNKIIVPIGNGLITVFNGIGIGLASIVNGVISAINWALGWAGVNLKKVSMPDIDDGKLTAISSGDLTAAGSSYIGGSSGSGASGSSTSVQSYTIEVHQVVQGNVIGEGGMEQIGRFFVEAVEAYLGSGGKVSFIQG